MHEYWRELARAESRKSYEPGEQEPARIAVVRQAIERALASEHTEHRFGHESAVVLTEGVVLSEIIAENHVGGMLELEHEAQRVDRGFEKVAVDFGLSVVAQSDLAHDLLACQLAIPAVEADSHRQMSILRRKP